MIEYTITIVKLLTFAGGVIFIIGLCVSLFLILGWAMHFSIDLYEKAGRKYEKFRNELIVSKGESK